MKASCKVLLQSSGLISCLAIISSISLPLASIAGEYDALCGGVDCKIVIDSNGFSGPAGFMPTHRIAQWYTGGGEEHNGTASAVGATGGALGGALVGGLATCWTIILCPIGLIGGGVAGGLGGSQAGKSADFYFTVIGYNQNGDKVTQSFNFLNKKPAGRMIQELPVITGLGMGELRSVEQIKAGDSRVAQTGSGREQLPTNIGMAPANASSKSLPSSLNERPSDSIAKDKSGKKCWSQFLVQPGMSVWAQKNKKQSESLRKKYDDC